MGASIGLMAGATTGGSAGAVGGGAIGFAGFTYREEIKRQGNHPQKPMTVFGGFFFCCVKIGAPTRLWKINFWDLLGICLVHDWTKRLDLIFSFREVCRLFAPKIYGLC